MIDQVPIFNELTDKENVSLGTKSTKLFTLAALYDASAELLKGREKDEIMANAALLVEYWNTIAQHMPDWNDYSRVTSWRWNCVRRRFRLTRQFFEHSVAWVSISSASRVGKINGGAGGHRLVQKELRMGERLHCL